MLQVVDQLIKQYSLITDIFAIQPEISNDKKLKWKSGIYI